MKLTAEQEALKQASNSGRDLEFEMLVSHELVIELFAALEAARNGALEEAAKACDAQATEPECPERASYCADAIRAMKSTAPKLVQAE